MDFSQLNIYTSPAIGDNAVQICNTHGRLLGFQAENLNTNNTVWVQIFDASAIPEPVSVPILEVKLATGDQASFDSGGFNYVPFENGLIFVVSLTACYYTPSMTNDVFVTFFWLN
jgi:hypothetical protein